MKKQNVGFAFLLLGVIFALAPMPFFWWIGVTFNSLIFKQCYTRLSKGKSCANRDASRPYWKPRAKGFHPSGHPIYFPRKWYPNCKNTVWCSVKKKYKLNVNFFHNTIFNQQLILNPLTLSNIYPHIHLVKDNRNGCVF